MSNPKRLLDGGTPFERALLSSSRLDVGALEGQKATLAAIGASATPVSASPTQAGHAAGAPAGTAATGLGAGGVSAAAKWVGIALVTAGAATGAAWRLGARESPPVVAPPLVVAPPSPTGDDELSTAAPTEMKTNDVPAPSVRGTLERPAIRPRRSVSSFSSAAIPGAAPAGPSAVKSGRATDEASASAALAEAAPELDAEIRALDGVRASLRSHDARDALARLDGFDSSFPRALLTDEAEVLRIDALMLKGDRAGAVALGRRFLAANPSSAHAPHLRALLSGDVQNP